jgi:hypothetical protein
MASTEPRIPKLEDFPPAVGAAGDAVVFEGAEATAFLESMATGTATEEYLREADRLYEQLYCSEPTNDLF